MLFFVKKQQNITFVVNIYPVILKYKFFSQFSQKKINLSAFLINDSRL